MSGNLMLVPLSDLKESNAEFKGELLKAIEKVIDSGSYILGEEVKKFEAELAHQIGAEQAVGVASGTDALILALRAGGIASGDEVIVPSHTAGPSVAAIRSVGAIPVLVEIDPEIACIDPEAVKEAIGTRTKAIMAVHLYGHPADMSALSLIAQQHNLLLIEDCAQAQGATIKERPVGSIGDFGCFSFYPTKNLGALGDGGALTGNGSRMDKARALRTYGWTSPQYAEYSGGWCSRLDELQAAVLNVKMRSLDQEIEIRRQIASRYNDALSNLPIQVPKERPGCRHVYHLYVIRTDRRDGLKKYLLDQGITTGLHYPYPVHLQPGLVESARIPRALVQTEMLCREILSLPLFPALTNSQFEKVVSAINDFFQGR